MTKRRKHVVLFLAVAAGLGGPVRTKADTTITSFTPGDVVVLRGGDNTNPVGSTGTTTVGAYLDEYTISGVYQGTLAVPQTVSGSNNALTISNLAQSHEGLLNLSPDGSWLTFGGYDTAPTTASSGAGVSPVTVGEVSQNASTLNTSTLLPVGGTIRGVTTFDGNEFWSTDSPGADGLYYINGTGPAATETQVNAHWSGRGISALPNGGLIVGSGSSTMGPNYANGVHGVYQIMYGNDAPTQGTNLDSLITGNTAAEDGTDFIFANEPGDTNLYEGLYNTLYSVGGASGAAAIYKYDYNGTNFVLVNSQAPVGGVNSVLIGVTAQVVGGNVDVDYTTNSGLYQIVDGDNATASLPNSGTTLVTAPSDEYFYGVALAPTTAVPEPTAIGFLAMAGIGLLSRRRRVG